MLTLSPEDRISLFAPAHPDLGLLLPGCPGGLGNDRPWLRDLDNDRPRLRDLYNGVLRLGSLLTP